MEGQYLIIFAFIPLIVRWSMRVFFKHYIVMRKEDYKDQNQDNSLN